MGVESVADTNAAVGWSRYYYTNALELARLAIERYMHTLDDAFAKRTMLPLTMGALRFFYEHYGPSPGEHRKRTLAPVHYYTKTDLFAKTCSGQK